ncbi:phospholipase [Vibrio inusitatus NBRC 102082]|uniref:Phospholipase A1 n=1 Tax=Vibrio inusitatus NBRC 102082 TaxID=1219070 RepID=A0A4Y3HVC1_9VIBR|nr:phospholipase A [Vibrio inusitatus]GEA51007.1 phospholipase [Vibrio inusitatus NBRC 102082]
MKTTHSLPSSLHIKGLALVLALGAGQVWANEEATNYETTFDNCLLRNIHMDTNQGNVEEIKQLCQQEQTTKQTAAKKTTTRHSLEKEIEYNPFVITPYRQNYILPFTSMNEVNTQPFSSDIFGDSADGLKDQEMKFQISFKVPIWTEGIFNESDELYFGFTLKSFLQAFSKDISSPFRDNNYRPEVFYETQLPIDVGEGVWFTRVGFEHESNGRTDELSRSWNRVFAGIGYEEQDFTVYLEPYHSIGEESDNKDITDYMGHFELTAAYKYNVLEFSGVGRYNFDTGYGGIEAGVSFPLLPRVRGYVQYYHGYGESLIDYDYNNQRIGVGILLTDVI